jgi:hypothetical protein
VTITQPCCTSKRTCCYQHAKPLPPSLLPSLLLVTPSQAARCLSGLGYTERPFWQQFAHSCERKLGAFTLSHLVTLLGAFCAVNFTPSLNWLERGYYQAKKHLRAGTAGDLSHLVWAWSEMGYTPRDQTIMNDIKSLARVRLKQQQYTGQQIVVLLHGMARLPRYCPNAEWLAAFAAALQPHLPSLKPGECGPGVLGFWEVISVG